MKVCLLSRDSILPYGMFITKIMKFYDVNLHQEIDIKRLKLFDTYNITFLCLMQFEHKLNSMWGRRSSMDLVGEDVHLKEDDENYEMEEVVNMALTMIL